MENLSRQSDVFQLEVSGVNRSWIVIGIFI